MFRQICTTSKGQKTTQNREKKKHKLSDKSLLFLKRKTTKNFLLHAFMHRSSTIDDRASSTMHRASTIEHPNFTCIGHRPSVATIEHRPSRSTLLHRPSSIDHRATIETERRSSTLKFEPRSESWTSACKYL